MMKLLKMKKTCKYCYKYYYVKCFRAVLNMSRCAFFCLLSFLTFFTTLDRIEQKKISFWWEVLRPFKTHVDKKLMLFKRPASDWFVSQSNAYHIIHWGF